MAVAQITVCGRTLHLREHVTERYQERVRPGLSVEQATAELVQVLVHARWTRVRPEWHNVGDDVADRPTDAWLLLGDDVAFPLHGNLIVTCVVRAGVSDATRERRSQRRRLEFAPQTHRNSRKQKLHGKVKARENARRRAQRDRLDA